jgi:hypothetical protein
MSKIKCKFTNQQICPEFDNGCTLNNPVCVYSEATNPQMKGHKDFKVIFTPAISIDAEFVAEYDTLQEAVMVLNAIANYTLMLHECSMMPDYSNMGAIYKNTTDEWVEIDDDGIEI